MNVMRTALSLTIHKRGAVSVDDAEALLKRYREKKGIFIDREIFKQALGDSRLHFENQTKTLFICTDNSCLRSTFVSPSDSSTQALSRVLNCAVETTGCHWQCADAPVVTFKFGHSTKSFLRCSSLESWHGIRDFISDVEDKTLVLLSSSIEQCK